MKINGIMLAAALSALALAGRAEPQGDKKVDTRVFEMRTYYAAPGKMDALHARFRNHTNKLLTKHGATLVGYWLPTDPKEAQLKLVYILAFPNREAGDKCWKAFRDDPDWIKARTESEKDGKLVDKVESVFLNPTDYSPLK